MPSMQPPTPRLALSLALLFSAACGADDGPRAAPEDAPNVVLISIDSLRPDHLGCYGHPFPSSPNIDRLGRSGVRFEEAVSTTSWTLPAHAALFTGLYDSAHGLVDNGQRLSDDHRTLAEEFQRNGWHTAGFFGGPYLHPTFGLAQGFDHYQSCMTTLDDGLGEEEVRAESRSNKGSSHADVTGPRTVEEVKSWLEGADERPFFLFVHLWDVHYDFIAPPEYVELFDPGYEGSITGVDFMTNRKIFAKMPPLDLQHLLALYDAEIRFTDDVIGQLLAVLESDGRMDNTIVVVTADHGEEFLDHSGKGHQRTLYDEVVLVPLIFHWEGRLGGTNGRVVPQQVRLIDVMPTLLTLAGIERRPEVSGRDLTPLLLGESLPDAPALCELLVDGREVRVLRTSSFKTVSLGPDKPPVGFDLRADPGEQAPIRAKEKVVREGLATLESELERARAFRAGRGAKTIEIDPEVFQRLRSLGYVEGDGSQ